MFHHLLYTVLPAKNNNKSMAIPATFVWIIAYGLIQQSFMLFTLMAFTTSVNHLSRASCMIVNAVRHCKRNV